MGTLQDELLKAGLVSEEQARQAKHDKRRRRKQETPAERERQAEEARRAHEQEQAARAEADRQREAERNAEAAKRQEQHRTRQQRESALAAVYRDGTLAGWEGNRRYYFANGSALNYVMVSEDAVRKLEAGQAAIAAGPGKTGQPVVVTATAARTLREVAPERLLAFHGS